MNTLTICVLIWILNGLAFAAWILSDKKITTTFSKGFVLAIITIIIWPLFPATLIWEFIKEKVERKKSKK